MNEKESFESRVDFFLPEYLENDLIALDKGIREKVSHVDCLLDEVQGSINMAYYDYYITWEQAETLRDLYL